MAEPVLRPGASGEVVRQLQSALQALGYHPGAIDGQFGSRTESAVKAFQRAQGIGVDGIVGDFTSLTLLAIDAVCSESFERRAQCVQEQLLEDLEHRYFSGIRVLRELARRRGRTIAVRDARRQSNPNRRRS